MAKAKTFAQLAAEAGDTVSKAPEDDDPRRREILARIRELVSQWVASKDPRSDVHRDEGLVRTVAVGEGADLASELIGLEPPADLAKRVSRALGLGDVAVAKSAGVTFGQIVRARQVAKAREILKDDPFADANESFAADVDRAILWPRPDLGELPFEKAVNAIEATYPGLLGKLLERSGHATGGEAVRELEKRAKAQIEATPSLSPEQAKDKVLREEPELMAKVLREEAR